MTFPAQDPIAPSVMTHAEYLALGGGGIPESEWTRYITRAARTVRQVTFGRDTTSFDTEVSEALVLAADAHFAATTGVISENLGRYSVTYRDSNPTPEAAAISALRGTGLTYTGLNAPASCACGSSCGDSSCSQG